jgi:Mg2+ and Co2+ transporter CorA
MANPIPHNWELPQVFRDRFGTHAGRQRVMHADGHLLIVLHDVPDPEEPGSRTGRLFWRKPDGSWKATGSGATNIAALRAHVEAFDAAAERLEAKVESATKARDWFEILNAAAPLLRTTRNLSRTLQEARDLAKADRELIAVRDQAQEIERAVELLHGNARDGLDFTVARNAEDSAAATKHMIEAGHRLNLITATFLPITALGTVLGMNLVHGLEAWHQPYTFWIVAAVAIVVGLVVRASLPKPSATPPA